MTTQTLPTGGRLGQLAAKTVIDGNGCWLWTRGKSHDGYARLGGKYVHREAYELGGGTIPEGWEVDHLCRTVACINPAHLEAVTREENQRRKNAAKTHCKSRHEFTPENTYMHKGRRQCRACNRAAVARYQRRNRVIA